MKRLILILALIAGSALADMVARNGADYLRLQDKPCTQENVPERDLFRAAVAVINGHEYPGCWTVLQGSVLVLYADGDKGLVPIEVFRPQEGV